MNKDEFVSFLPAAGICTKKQAEEYVKSHPKESYDSYEDGRDAYRMSEAKPRHQHGFNHFGRLSGLRQDELSCTR